MTDSDIVEIAQLIYHQWSEAQKILLAVKKEAPDGSEPDWAEFHEIRYESAKADEWKWDQMRQRFMNEHREVINKAYGL